MRIHKRNTVKKSTILVLAGLVALALIAGLFYYYKVYQPQRNKELFGSETTNPTSNQPKSDSTKDGGQSSIGNSKDDDANTAQPAPPADSSTPPATPLGVFVSNHHPNLSGSPAPNTMNSTCVTTAGASCSIEFQNGSVTKRLGPKMTDNNGNVNWNWKLQDIGLTAGTWTVTAVATNGTQTSKASDPTKLEVSP